MLLDGYASVMYLVTIGTGEANEKFGATFPPAEVEIYYIGQQRSRA